MALAQCHMSQDKRSLSPCIHIDLSIYLFIYLVTNSPNASSLPSFSRHNNFSSPLREDLTQQLDWLASASRDEIDPDDEGLYDDLMDEVEPSWSQLLLTCTLATRLDELLEDTQDVGKESAAVLEAIQGRHAWIVDWQDYGWWTQADAWPEGPFREAIAARPEDDVW